MQRPTLTIRYLNEFASQKNTEPSDSIEEWSQRYLQFAVIGVRSSGITKKIALHLDRFRCYFVEIHDHDRLSCVLKRELLAWRESLLTQNLARSTVNNHLASISGFCTWVEAQNPQAFPTGNPCKGIKELGLPASEAKALDEAQIRSLKNLLDRLPSFHVRKGRRNKVAGSQAHARPYRDRAMVYAFLSTGIRREELVNLDLSQLEPNIPEALRRAKKARIVGVIGKGGSVRHVYLSSDARLSLADYLEKERGLDTGSGETALFLSACSIATRAPGGRLSLKAINLIVHQIGIWHDAEQKDPARHISPLYPHKLRHTFGVQLSEATNHNAYELQRQLGHSGTGYLHVYTRPREDISAGFVERF